MIKIITILIGVVILAIRFWPKTKTVSTATSATPATPTTKKFSWGWIVTSATIIIIVIIFAGLLQNIFDGKKVVAEMVFAPNVWAQEDLGWQKLFDGEKGKYQISVSGQWYKSTKTGNFQKIPPEGKKLSFPDNFTLPIPDAPFGALIGRVGKKDGAIFLIGKNATIVLDGDYPVYISVNIPQNWRVSPGTKKNDAFANNKGTLDVKVEKLL